MRWTKLTGLEVEFESDITSSTVTYPLPSQKSGQKGGQISGSVENINTDNQYNILNKGGQTEVVRIKERKRDPRLSKPCEINLKSHVGNLLR